jgi:cytochrome c oxidase cbb3-type subunit 4
MDQGIIGSIFTVVVFLVFAGVVWWSFSSRNKKRFDEAANLPFADEDPTTENNEKDKRES